MRLISSAAEDRHRRRHVFRQPHEHLARSCSAAATDVTPPWLAESSRFYLPAVAAVTDVSRALLNRRRSERRLQSVLYLGSCGPARPNCSLLIRWWPGILPRFIDNHVHIQKRQHPAEMRSCGRRCWNMIHGGFTTH